MIEISEWERGFSFAPKRHDHLRMYLWFYEWHLFDAFCRFTRTSYDIQSVSDGHRCSLTIQH